MYDTAVPAAVAKTYTPVVLFVVGASGIGKTTTVLDYLGQDSVYMHDYGNVSSQTSWPNYDATRHSTVMFDEFRGQLDPSLVNKLLSGQGVQGRQSGGAAPMLYPDVVVFASQTYPQDWSKAWQTVHVQQAFARRVHWTTHYLRHDLDVYHPTAITDFWDENLWNPARQHFENSKAKAIEAFEANDKPRPDDAQIRNLMQDQKNMRLNLAKWEAGHLCTLITGQTL